MVKWLNHVAIAAPRNGTNSHSVSPSSGTVVSGSLFTPTAGRFLVVAVEGAVTSTTPSGWTLPSGGSAVNNTGLYFWYRTAAGNDSLSTTHNGSNYPVVFDFYEFPAGTSFIGAASQGNVSGNGGAGPSLSGLTSDANFRAAIVGQNRSAPTTASFTWDTGTESVDTSVGNSGTDGYGYSLTYLEDQTGATFSAAATSTDTATTCERLVIALNAATEAGGTEFPATTTVTASSTVVASPAAKHPATAASGSTSGVAPVAAAVHPASAGVSASSEVDASPVAVHAAQATVPVSSVISADPEARHPAATSVSASSAVVMAPSSVHPASAGVVSVSGSNLSPTATHPASAALASSSTVSATATVAGQSNASVGIDSSSSVTATAGVRRASSVTVSSTSASAASPVASHVATALVSSGSAVLPSAHVRFRTAASTPVLSTVLAHPGARMRIGGVTVSSVSAVQAVATLGSGVIVILEIDEVERNVRIVGVARDILIDEVLRNVRVKEVR